MRQVPASAPCFNHFHQLIREEISLTDRLLSEQALVMAHPEVPEGQVLWGNQPTPSNNEWLIRMQKKGRNLRYTSFYQYQTWEGQALALVPSCSNFILHITAHALSRIRSRLHLPQLPDLQIFESLARRLTSPEIRIIPNKYNQIVAILDGGLGLGNLYQRYKALAIKTFIPFDRLSPLQFNAFHRMVNRLPASDFNRQLFYYEWQKAYGGPQSLVA